MGKRKNSTKAERTALLKKLGYTEADMQKFWDECIPVNYKIRMLSNAGLNWTDLCIWQIEQLPTLKEVTIKQLEEKEKAAKAEAEAKQRQEEQREYYEEHFDEIMVQKIDNNEELTTNEIRDLVCEGNIIEEIPGENRRWTRTVKSIIELEGRYFLIAWEQGLTENQPNEYYNQPYEVVCGEYKKVVDVKKWIPKGESLPHRENELKANDVSDDVLNSIIDTITEYMYCNFDDCKMQNGMEWSDLEKVRQNIKDNAMDMIKSNLKSLK